MWDHWNLAEKDNSKNICLPLSCSLFQKEQYFDEKTKNKFDMRYIIENSIRCATKSLLGVITLSSSDIIKYSKKIEITLLADEVANNF